MPTDFAHCHRHTLPARAAALDAGQLLARLGPLPPVALRLAGSDEVFTYRLDAQGLRIEPGDAGEALMGLDAATWQGFVEDLESIPAVIYGQRVAQSRGRLMDFMQWEPLLRTLYQGIPLYPPGEVQPRDRSGRPLDLARGFPLSEEADTLRDYLEGAGYLLLQGVFSPEEVALMRAEVEALRSQAREGDGSSWWATDAGGQRVACRLLRAGQRPPLSTLYQDARILRMASVMPPGLKPCDPAETDAITAIFKLPHAREGLADLPWHRDCGMGGHARMCPTIVVSIYLYDATPEAGALHFLPGSHRYSLGVSDAQRHGARDGVVVPARAGDVTLHHSDVMHAAPAPTGREGPFRVSVLLSFKPDYQPHHGDSHYNDVLLKGPGGKVESLDVVAARSSRSDKA